MTKDVELAERFASAVGSGDVEGLKAVLAADATWWIPGSLPVSGLWRGHAEIFDGMFGVVGKVMEPGTLKLEVRRTIGQSKVVAMEWSVRAQSTSGREYMNDYAVVLEIEGGAIVAVREYTDLRATEAALFADRD